MIANLVVTSRKVPDLLRVAPPVGARLLVGAGVLALVTMFGAAVAPHLAWAVVCENAGAGDAGATDGSLEINTACGENANAASTNSGIGGNDSGNTAIGRSADASGTDITGQGGSNTAIGNGANANGDNGENSAFGAHADASGVESFSTAIGSKANASGFDSENAAMGNIANARGAKSANLAVGKAADATGYHSFNTATGKLANAGGDQSANIASGLNADASGSSSTNIAIGNSAVASGDNSANTALGAGAEANGDNSIAIGPQATASDANSAAFGNGATATRANQQAFGIASNTYTMEGITSDASRTAQGNPTHIVTSNAKGDLAAYTFSQLGVATPGDIKNIKARIDGLGDRDKELVEELAAVLALAQRAIARADACNARLDETEAVGFSAEGVVAGAVGW